MTVLRSGSQTITVVATSFSCSCLVWFPSWMAAWSSMLCKMLGVRLYFRTGDSGFGSPSIPLFELQLPFVLLMTSRKRGPGGSLVAHKRGACRAWLCWEGTSGTESDREHGPTVCNLSVTGNA